MTPPSISADNEMHAPRNKITANDNLSGLPCCISPFIPASAETQDRFVMI